MDTEDTKTLDTLKHSDWNPRSIDKHDFEALVKSMREFGDLSGVVKNLETGTLVGGNQRLEAFKKLANPIIRIEHRFLDGPNAVGTISNGYIELENGERFAYREVIWPLEKEKAANIAANRIQGQFDLDLLAKVNYELSQLENGAELLKLSGQTEDEINKLLDSVGALGEEQTEDEVPEVDNENPPVSKLGEIYQLGRHRLMCGDATSLDDVTELMNGQQADLIWTDPPYNVAYEGKTADALTIQNDKFKDSEAFYDFLYLAFSNLNAVTKAGASIYICHADLEGLNFRKAMIEAGFPLRAVIVWNKNTMVLGRGDYQWKHEPILYGWKEGASHYFVEDRDMTTVWEFDKPSRSEDHPTMKPIALVKYAIKNSSKRDQLVVDTFGGSGSTLIAADEMDRSCNVMELDPKYCDVIRKRYAKHINQEENWQELTPVIQAALETIESQNEAPIAG